jgi:hypothetical protein
MSKTSSRRRTRVFLVGVAMTLLLFGGATLAASAADLTGDGTLTDSTGSESTEPGALPDPAPAPDPVEAIPPAAPPPAPPPAPVEEPAPNPTPPPPAPAPAPMPTPPSLPAPGQHPVVVIPPAWLDKPETAPLDPEVRDGTGAVVWLYRVLPDPTPPAKRLAPAFARKLRSVARGERVHWSLLLGVLRASGHEGRAPATGRQLRSLAHRLRKAGVRKDLEAGLVAYFGRAAFAEQAVALTRYNRAVGLRALVRGLAASKEAFQRRILASRRIDLYALGQADVASGRIDVRVLVLMLYLARAHGEVSVSSLQSGHRLFAQPGVVSAHVHGLAVDITALGKVSISGNQQPGGLTERAVRDILLLPAELQPRQVISLLGLGGASFPLADHGDHIHVGY